MQFLGKYINVITDVGFSIQYKTNLPLLSARTARLSSDLNGFENGTEVQHRPVRSWTMYLRRRIKWPLRIPRPSQLYKKLGCPKPLCTASKKA